MEASHEISSAPGNPVAPLGCPRPRGTPIGITRTATEAFQIVPIIVVAIRTPEGLRPAAPALFFTLVKIKELAV
jgi:hypothetical protein